MTAAPPESSDDDIDLIRGVLAVDPDASRDLQTRVEALAEASPLTGGLLRLLAAVAIWETEEADLEAEDLRHLVAESVGFVRLPAAA